MIDPTITCEQCRHPECHGDSSTKLCVFCEDGEPCPVELERWKQMLQPAPVQFKESSLAPKKTTAKDVAMKFSKHCTNCHKGIRGTHAKCRDCRVKAGEIDTNASRKAKRNGKAPAAHRRSRKPAMPTPPVFTAPAPTNGNGHSQVLVPVQVPEELLDLWWSDRTPQEKAAIAGNHLLMETARVLGHALSAGQAQGSA